MVIFSVYAVNKIFLSLRLAPVPMEDIERMAALCMKDLDDDEDDGDLENDADLLVRGGLLHS